jgi:Resolvase, N terminal domain
VVVGESVTESIDTTTPGGKLVFHFLGALAEFERNLIRERRPGWQRAHTAGVAAGEKSLVRSSVQCLPYMCNEGTLPVRNTGRPSDASVDQTPTRPPRLSLAVCRPGRLSCCRTSFVTGRLSPWARERVLRADCCPFRREMAIDPEDPNGDASWH